MDGQLTRKQLQDIQKTIDEVALLKRMRGNNGVFVRFEGGIPQISGSVAAAATPGTQVIFIKITGRSGTKYAFTQYTTNSGGTPTVVSGGITGTTSSGYVQDIAGFADDGLIGKYALAIPNALVPDTWIMGPWNKVTASDVTAASGTCSGFSISITLTKTTSTIYYIGG